MTQNELNNAVSGIFARMAAGASYDQASSAVRAVLGLAGAEMTEVYAAYSIRVMPDDELRGEVSRVFDALQRVDDDGIVTRGELQQWLSTYTAEQNRRVAAPKAELKAARDRTVHPVPQATAALKAFKAAARLVDAINNRVEICTRIDALQQLLHDAHAWMYVTPDAIEFFYENAGYSHDPKTETAEQGRRRCAERLAYAEAQARLEGYEPVWEEDDSDSSKFSDEKPAYGLWCCIYPDPECGASLAVLGGIDLGRDGTPYGLNRDNYCRVVEAELAAEIFP